MGNNALTTANKQGASTIYQLGASNLTCTISKNHNKDISFLEYQSLLAKKVSVTQFLDTFSDENKCLSIYFHLQFDGKKCVKCGKNITECYSRILRKDKNGVQKKAYKCRICKTYIYPMANSIFSGSPIPFNILFYLIYSFCFSGLSGSTVKDTLGVTYATAHRLLKLLRTLLYESHIGKLSGTVEVDEAFFGSGGAFNNWSGISTRKSPVIGLYERGTKQVRIFLAPDRKSKTINKILLKNIEQGSTVYTDSWVVYNRLKKWYNHEYIDHKRGEYVRGNVSTNGIENMWGQIKRTLRKNHIKITDKYIHLYLAESAWRHNSRNRQKMDLFNEILVRSFSVFDYAIT